MVGPTGSVAGVGNGGDREGGPAPVAESDVGARAGSRLRIWWRRLLGRKRYAVLAEPEQDGPCWTLVETDDVTEALSEWTILSVKLRKRRMPDVALLLFTVDGRVARRELRPKRRPRVVE